MRARWWSRPQTSSSHRCSKAHWKPHARLRRRRVWRFTRTTTPSLTARLDPVLTRSAIANLADNAVKYTDAGEVHVEVLDRRDEIVVNVSDTCPGLSPEELRTIFEPFKRGRSAKGGPAWVWPSLAAPWRHRAARSAGSLPVRPGVGSRSRCRNESTAKRSNSAQASARRGSASAARSSSTRRFRATDPCTLVNRGPLVRVHSNGIRRGLTEGRGWGGGGWCW